MSCTVAMDTIYDDEETNDSVVLIKLERDFTISRDQENVFCLYRVSYENISLLSGTESFPGIAGIDGLEYEAENFHRPGKWYCRQLIFGDFDHKTEWFVLR